MECVHSTNIHPKFDKETMQASAAVTGAIVPYGEQQDKKKTAQTGFEHLPIDIQLAIFQQWGFFQGLSKFACTAKPYNDLVSKLPIWKSFAHQIVPHSLENIRQNGLPDYRSIVNNNIWNLSTKEANCLSIIESNLRIKIAKVFTRNFRNAYKCMHNGKSQNFDFIIEITDNFVNTGQVNALDFLVSCFHKKGTAARIIDIFQKSRNIYRYKLGSPKDCSSLTIQMNGPEIAQELQQLIKRTKLKIKAIYKKELIDKIKKKLPLISPTPKKLIACVKKPRSVSMPPPLVQNK